MTSRRSTPDATILDPDHYRVEFENEFVRVVRIRYGPGERSAALHSHPPGVRVFLTDLTARVEVEDGTAEALTMERGSVDWLPATVHEPHNTSDQPFELVLVEVKAAKEAQA